MGLTATELGRHIEHRRGLGDLARQAPDHLRREQRQVLRQKGAVEEPLRVLVVLEGATVPDVVQVDGELRGVERPAETSIPSTSVGRETDRDNGNDRRRESSPE